MRVKFGELITKKSTEIKLSTMDYRLRTKKGIALLMVIAMICSLAIVVVICAFVLSREVNKDERYEITRQRMLEVKRALIGRLADVSGGEDITSCGGFINDYGEPGDANDKGNIMKILLGNIVPVDTPLVPPPNWPNWDYDDINYEFWAGYRGDKYLKAPPAQPKPSEQFLDGWGYPIEVTFIQDTTPEHTVITIKSNGSDGLAGGSGNYTEDQSDTFYWKRGSNVNATIRTKNLVYQINPMPIRTEVIYPFQGKVQKSATVDVNFDLTAGIGNGTFTFAGNFPVGSRKIIFSVGPGGPGAGNLLATKMLCISPAQAVAVTPLPSPQYTLNMDVEI